MLYNVTHCTGRVSANTRPYQPNCYLMNKMQSDGWPYSKGGRDSLKAWSLRAAVLCAAVLHASVFQLKILHSNRLSHVIGVQMCVCSHMHLLPNLRKSLLALKDTESNTITILTSAVCQIVISCALSMKLTSTSLLNLTKTDVQLLMYLHIWWCVCSNLPPPSLTVALVLGRTLQSVSMFLHIKVCPLKDTESNTTIILTSAVWVWML